MRRVSSQDIVKMKAGGVRIVAVTAYDYSFARHIDEAGADMILVGDSLGMVVYGHKDTLRVTMEQMIAHTRADLSWPTCRSCRIRSPSKRG